MKDKFIPDCDKTKTNGTFKEWIDSVAEEVRRLLAIKTARVNEPEPDCVVEVEERMRHSDLRIVVYMDDEPMNYFSFTKKEFEKNQKSPKALEQLLHMRFIDFLWNLYDTENERLTFLRKFGIKYKSLNNVK